MVLSFCFADFPSAEVSINSCHFIVTFSLTSALKRGKQFAWKLNQSVASGHWVRLRGGIGRCDDERWLHPVTVGAMNACWGPGLCNLARWSSVHLSVQGCYCTTPLGTLCATGCAWGPEQCGLVHIALSRRSFFKYLNGLWQCELGPFKCLQYLMLDTINKMQSVIGQGQYC